MDEPEERPKRSRDDIAERIAVWFRTMRSALSNGMSSESRQHLMDHPQSSSNRNASTDYTELNGGSVPCPSCNGSGLIPKELESTLVALIPVNDERLKPKRTWIYILVWIAVCILIGSIMIFILMPRTVTLSSNREPVQLVNVTRNETHTLIDFFFMNRINISSGNYLPVSVVNITASIIDKFDPWSSDVVGTGMNDTFSMLGPLDLYRNTRELYFNNSVELKGIAAEYCQTLYSHLTSLYVSLQFDVAVTLQYYYGHKEQITLSMQQMVCCIPSGNCTSPDY